MTDEFLHHLRKDPRPEFAARLRARLRRQSAIPPRRAPSRARGLFVLLLLGGTAFAFTLAVKGVPAQILRLFRHEVSRVASTGAGLPRYDAVSHAAARGRAPDVATPTPPTPAAVAVPALPDRAELDESGSGPWQYFLSGDTAPLLRGWIHQGLPAGWQVHDGVLSKRGLVEDLESTRTYRDFVLELQWKISASGDSGIFYRGTHDYSRIWLTAPEYQLVDDSTVGPNRLVATGSVFALYPSPAGVVHPYGEWNSTRIVVRGNDVEYWLNGQRIINYTLGSDDWMLRVSESKFAPFQKYGRMSEGLIGLQGTNNGSLEVRDMRILVLP